MSTALAGSRARLGTGLGCTFASVTGLDAFVETTIQTLATDLATGWLGDVAWDVGHLGLAAHAGLGHEDNARRAGFAVWVAGVG